MTPTVILDFQQDLRNGLTIESALQKHNLTFKEVMTELGYKARGRTKAEKRNSKGYTGEQYITKNSGKYLLRKKIGGKFTYFGRYNTLEDAIKVREWMIEHHWDKSRLNALRRRLGV